MLGTAATSVGYCHIDCCYHLATTRLLTAVVKTTALNISKPHCVWIDISSPALCCRCRVPLPYRAFGEAESFIIASALLSLGRPRLSQMHPQDDGTLLEGHRELALK